MKFSPGLAAVALAATVLAQPASAATTTPVSPAKIAGDWIAAEVPDALAAGDFDFYQGQLIDAGLALRATGHQTDAHEVAEALAPRLVTTEPNEYGYVTSTEYDTYTDPTADPVYLQVGRYGNPTAKAAAFTERVGLDASTQYADVDLIAQLEDLTDDTTGRIFDDSSYGSYTNTIGQAFAVEALTNAGSSEAGAATDALLAQQCDAGFFPLDLGATCPTSEAYPDVTALAVISLVESGATSPEVSAAIASAADWLESLQLPDGSFPGDGGASGANTNGTGLAGWALGEAGRTAAAAKAAVWTRGLQVSDAGACATQAPTGAIAYNADDFTSGRVEGLGTKQQTWRIASYQAAPLLRWAPAASGALAIATPSTATEKVMVNAVVSGLAAGEYACVTLGGTVRSVKGTGSDVTVPFELPTGSGSYPFSVTTLGGTQSSTTTVPAPVSPTPTSTPPTEEPIVGELTTSKVEWVRNNTFKLTVSCDSAAACDGKLKVRTVHKVELRNGSVRKLLVAKTEYSVGTGETATVRLKLQRPARAVLGSKRLRVVATQTARGAETASAAFWLRRK